VLWLQENVTFGCEENEQNVAERVKKLHAFEQSREKRMSLENKKEKLQYIRKKVIIKLKTKKNKESEFCCISRQVWTLVDENEESEQKVCQKLDEN